MEVQEEKIMGAGRNGPNFNVNSSR